MASRIPRRNRPRGSSPDHSGPHTLVRLLFVLGFSLLSVMLLLLVSIHLPPVQDLIVAKSIQGLERSTGVQLKFSSFRWWPFSRLSLNQISLVRPGKEKASFEQVTLSYRLVPSFPFFEPKALRLKKPVLDLSTGAHAPGETGSIGLGGEKTGEGRPRGFPLSLSTIPVEVEGGTVRVHKAGGEDLLLSVADLQGRMTVSVRSRLDNPEVEVRLNDLQGQLFRPEWGALRVSGGIRWQDGLTTLESVEVALGQNTHLAAHGDISFDDQRQSHLEIQLAPWDWHSVSNIDTRLSALGPVTGTLRLIAESGLWRLEQALESQVGKLDGVGSWSRKAGEEKTLQWSATFTELRFPENLGFPEVNLNGNLQVLVRGSDLSSAVGQFECRLDKSAWSGEEVDKGELLASFEGGRVSLKSLALKAPLGKVTASGKLDVAGLWNPKVRGAAEAKIEVDGLDLHKLVPTLFSQQVLDMRVALQATHDPGEFQQWENWQGEVNLHLNAPRFLTVTTTGTYKNRKLEAHYSLNGQSLEILGKLFPDWVLTGQVESQGDLKGHWPNLSWDGSATFRRLQYQGAQCESCVVKGHGDLLGRRADRSLALQATGVSGGGLQLRNLRIEMEQKESACTLKVAGERSTEAGSFQFTANTPDLWSLPVKLKVPDGRIVWPNQSWTVEGQVAADRDEFVIDSLKMRQGTQEVGVLGKLSWGRENHLQLKWENLKLEPVLSLLRASPQLSGLSSGSLQLTGSFEQPRWTAELKVTGGKLYRETLSESIVKASYGGQQLSVSGTLHSSVAETPIVISGQIPLNFSLKPLQCVLMRDDPWSSSLQVVGLNVENLASYVPGLEEVSGRMEVSAKLGGTLAHPEISGRGIWTGGSLQLKAWPHAAQNIHMEWRGDGHQITIPNASMDVLGGRATASGQIKLGMDLDPEIDLHASAQQIEIPEIYGITGNGSGKFDLKLKGRDTKLSGEFQFARAVMNLGEFESDLDRNIQVVGDETDAQIVEVGTVQKHKPGPTSGRVDMDLELKTPKSGTWVRGKGLEAEVTGAVRLTKEDSGPLKVFGSLKSVRGTYTFQGHRINIVEGELAFLGVTEPIPTLQVLGQKEAPGATIQVRVSGPLSQPKLLLSSVPAMNQVDVLSYLLYGRPATQLNSKENQGLQQNAAVFFGSEASREFKKLLGNSPLAPDVLQVSNSPQGGGGVVEIGKYLTPELYVTYEKGLSSSQGDQVQMEYRINRHLSIQSQFGLNQPRSVETQLPERNQSGVDVLWRYDFGD